MPSGQKNSPNADLRETRRKTSRASVFLSRVKVSAVTQSCPTLCDPVDCSPPGSSVHGILQVRILEWVAISSSREASRPRAPALQADALPSEPPGKQPSYV